MLRGLGGATPNVTAIRSCNAILETSTDDDLAFLDGFRSVEGAELFPGGGSITVTQSNKYTYIELLADSHVRKNVESSMDILAGIMHVLHSDKVKTVFVALMRMAPVDFNELVGGGLGRVISPDDWQAHTLIEVTGDFGTFVGPRRPTVNVVDPLGPPPPLCFTLPLPFILTSFERAAMKMAAERIFFDMIRDMTHDGRMLLLRFWTGLHCLPIDGFAGMPRKLRLVIDTDAPTGRMPTVHTCIMSMSMPMVLDPEALQAKFALAMASMEMDDK